MTLAIGPVQIILFFLVMPVVFFVLGFWLGKKSGYIKGVKEESSK